MSSWRYRVGLGAVVLMLLVCYGLPSASGQTAVDGVVHGVVMDAGGAALRGARVWVEDAATGFVAWVATDQSGEFLVARVPVGTYRMVVEAAGFKMADLVSVTVFVSVTRTKSVMEPASTRDVAAGQCLSAARRAGPTRSAAG